MRMLVAGLTKRRPPPAAAYGTAFEEDGVPDGADSRARADNWEGMW
jgi:hypothetical protein